MVAIAYLRKYNLICHHCKPPSFQKSNHPLKSTNTRDFIHSIATKPGLPVPKNSKSDPKTYTNNNPHVCTEVRPKNHSSSSTPLLNVSSKDSHNLTNGVFIRKWIDAASTEYAFKPPLRSSHRDQSCIHYQLIATCTGILETCPANS